MNEQKVLRQFFAYIFFVVFIVFFVSIFVIKSEVFSFKITVLYILIASVICSLIVVFLTSFFNDITKIVSAKISSVARLENPNNPLLQKLSKEAPGTFSHSMAVAELAKAAGETLGLDPSLLRVGGYYHDIGKLRTPRIYIENHSGTAVSTDKIQLAKSIIDHVRIGVKTAREHNFPNEVTDLIAQHHGTSTIDSLKAELLKQGVDLQYPGPKPLSKEAAILMLSDCVEASVRSKRHSKTEILEKEIENQIIKIIKSGQIDLSNLSSEDIKKIKKSFIKTITGLYHKRKHLK